ncbi:hypothetical protein ACLOJK_024757 [Asimina triloba]
MVKKKANIKKSITKYVGKAKLQEDDGATEVPVTKEEQGNTKNRRCGKIELYEDEGATKALVAEEERGNRKNRRQQ